MSLTNPFAKPAPKKTAAPSKPIQKTDATRENVKKQLLNALEKSKDTSLKDIKLTSEEIAKEIEEQIFKQNDDSSKSKQYRDKIRKLEMRLKGPRNNYIRELLKKGKLSVFDFCNINDKDLMDDKYFKQLEGNTTENTDEPKKENNKNIKNNNNPPKMIPRIAKPPPFKNIIMPKPPVIKESINTFNEPNKKEIK